MPTDTKYRSLRHSDEGTGASKQKESITIDQHPHKSIQEYMSTK